ncbi:Platelet-activating factor acetylhydrolase plasma/intracellular isoform II [Kribbella flavida DSM 17836]|uniref:Platelet-activating factor acetylhydrolase plasma/intracellular isoform II n=1 Tax=Kribbella flavida (strain DSM 17836 / JCM 10339 / NBRC 14399) TaxID=479435 RepID=D2PUP0_KRIFD|nr:Platelet-activating factor acetylhydrolase plasma/intracellular isoform II [Kribbella flavida]ADB29558.1 Platelet-activating factor acetylhydrolase plasma/intracellular isoform II [Kribbella flavida DSM 17836]
MLSRRLLLTGTAATLLPAAPATASARNATGGALAGSRSPVRLRFPRPTGPFPVGTTELHLVDAGRDDPFVPGRPRELMISIWYPAARAGADRAPYLPPLTAQVYAEGAAIALQQPLGTVDWAGARHHAGLLAPVSRSWGRRPVILFSPGFGVPRGLASVMVAELAGRGYVVVTVDHTYEAAAVEFPGGRVALQTLPPKPYALLARQTRLTDVRRVLDALTDLAHGRNPDAGQRRLPAGLGAVLDLSRVGAFGHSAGGITSADVMLADRRVRAGINLDGTLGYGYPSPCDSPTVARGTDRPFLLVGAGGTGPDGGPQTHRTDPSWGLFWERSTGWKRDLNVPAGGHYTFIDHQVLIPWFQRFFTVPPELVATTVGTVDAERILRSLRTYLPGFFDQHLRGRPGSWRDSPRHPDVRFIA